MNAIENVIDVWRKVGVRLNPGASPEDIRRLETALGVSLPSDVLAYFSTMNGIDEEHTAEWLSSFWSIEKILTQWLEREGSDEVGPYQEVAFADVMIDSWFLWFRVRPPGQLSIFVEGSDEEKPTLCAAFERYVELSKGWYW